MEQLLQNFDLPVLQFIQEFLHNPIMDKLMLLLTYLSNGGIIWISISLCLIIDKKYRKAGIMVLSSLILATILSEGLLKHLVQRPRPFVDYPAFKLLIETPSTYSFPSGHTTSSFAVAGVLAKNFKKYGILIFGAAFLIAFSRLYLFVHYPTDVLFGMLLGLICAFIINTIVKKQKF